MKKFELYFKEIHIGSLTETNWDMRSAGNIIYHYDFYSEDAQNSLLAALIRHSIKADIYWEEFGEDENYHKMCEEENQFLEIINTPDWYIVNEQHKKIKILCPLFHDNNQIVWQEDYLNIL
ncbi:hypothetical protein ACFSJW_06200 [Flavobacterium artemisiae]|uniref:Uncharacterized protein n=1 Tax=Flavobacterium artemisiae TaxID=2126556 RepID=A0ABW4HCW2_9FLAO